MSTQNTEVNDPLEACADLIVQGTANAISGLSQMLDLDIEVTTLVARKMPVMDTPDVLGGPEALTVGIYLSVTGAAGGHIFLVYPSSIALTLVDLLMGQPIGTTRSLEEMEASALAEMGNIMGSFFLNALADLTGLALHPSPPAVMMDMAGAILDAVLADILRESDDVLMVETKFGVQDQEISGLFLVMPSPDLLRVLLDHWTARLTMRQRLRWS